MCTKVGQEDPGDARLMTEGQHIPCSPKVGGRVGLLQEAVGVSK